MATQSEDGKAATAAPADSPANRKPLTDAARRALAEAAERRSRQAAVERPRELNGREGPDPVRYGDWENKGIASDF